MLLNCHPGAGDVGVPLAVDAVVLLEDLAEQNPVLAVDPVLPLLLDGARQTTPRRRRAVSWATIQIMAGTFTGNFWSNI